ncbi:hypothetical protein [Massilia sp. METH4]|uniref:hypothetical protein n=1 Tax=Massilia sp. METH4 TaxID=3123041 RepID=UPI0030CAC53C
MHNSAGYSELAYTTEYEEYKGYLIDWATEPDGDNPQRFFGNFRARKDGKATLGMMTALPLETRADAKNEAIRFARAEIDKVAGDDA